MLGRGRAPARLRRPPVHRPLVTAHPTRGWPTTRWGAGWSSRPGQRPRRDRAARRGRRRLRPAGGTERRNADRAPRGPRRAASPGDGGRPRGRRRPPCRGRVRLRHRGSLGAARPRHPHGRPRPARTRRPRQLAPRRRRPADRHEWAVRAARRRRTVLRPGLPWPRHRLEPGEEIYAEVTLPEEAREAADGFGLHPALLDAALHAWPARADDLTSVELPFLWTGVSLYATGASRLRVRLTPVTGGGMSVLLADETGRPVASAGTLVTRPLQDAGTTTGQGAGTLHRVRWAPVPVPAAGTEFAAARTDSRVRRPGDPRHRARRRRVTP
ncbi:polyketide synthase dehydratase domain-containing protein [Streptomyces sp. GKU 257-1]|nr:polyketide synthase dehydratase domain-containing protein [Streptomyces sp. GKU 257-1]